MRLQIASDGIAGVQTAIWVDDKPLTDVTALQVNMSAYGLNTAVLKRVLSDGTRVQLDLYGGGAFHELRKAAMNVLAAVEGLGEAGRALLATSDMHGLPECIGRLRTAVARVQDEVAG